MNACAGIFAEIEGVAFADVFVVVSHEAYRRYAFDFDFEASAHGFVGAVVFGFGGGDVGVGADEFGDEGSACGVSVVEGECVLVAVALAIACEYGGGSVDGS